MIKLYKFGPEYGLREFGPFALKLMSYMRLSGIDFDEEIQGNPTKAPKGKIPYIDDDGALLGDSTLIIKYLKDKYGDPLSDGLSAEQLALGHAVKVMLEERTYWAGMIYPRWVKKDHHKLLASNVLADAPGFLRGAIFGFIARGVVKNAKAQGTALHSEAEVYQLGLDDIKTIETLLGAKDYMLGDKPAEVDCTVFAFLHGMNAEVFPTPIQAYIKGSLSLQAYLARMEAAVFGAQ